MKKKLIAILITASLAALALAACSQKPKEPETPESSSVETGSGAEDPGKIVGGWTINDDETVGFVTDDAKAAFDKALEGLVGADYKIISLLGTQVVSGVNYEYLCEKKTVTPNAEPTLCYVVVYQDLQGNAEITHVEDLDLGAFYGGENPADEKAFEQLMGGWSIPENIPAVNLPEPVAGAYDQAMNDQPGYTPVAYLGSQVVSGANYAVLCFDENAPCIVYIYAPLNADAELVSIYKINMAEYSGN